MDLIVTPDEFVALRELADRAARYIPLTNVEKVLFGTALSDDLWIRGVRELFGEPTTTLMLHNGPVRVIVDNQGQR